MGIGTALVGGGLAAGGSIAGGLISAHANKKAAKQSWKYQKKVLKNQIRWRVADAKAAGIHPLFALGASPASYQPTPDSGYDVGKGIADAGQAIGGAVSRIGGREERKEQTLRNQLLQAQIGETDARTQAIHSEIARNAQNARSQVSGAETQLGVMDEDTPSVRGALLPQTEFIYESDLQYAPNPKDHPGAGLVDMQAYQQNTHKKGNRGIVAGSHPGYKEFMLPTGLPILLPEGQSLSEVLEETPFWLYKNLYELNKHHYGAEWAQEFWEFLWHGRSGMTGKYVK